jgi:hypothetical protein
MNVLTCFGKERAEALIRICSFTLFGQVSVRLTMNISMFSWLQIKGPGIHWMDLHT